MQNNELLQMVLERALIIWEDPKIDVEEKIYRTFYFGPHSPTYYKRIQKESTKASSKPIKK